MFRRFILSFFLLVMYSYSSDIDNIKLKMNSMSNEKTESELWSLVETRDKEFPVFLRFLNRIPEEIKTNDYQHMISIFWSYPVIDKSGLPSKKIMDAHSDIEEILNKLDDHKNSFYVAQITGNGRKEWIWYTNNVDKWWKGFISGMQGHEKYPLDMQVAKEPNWETYSTISNNMSMH